MPEDDKAFLERRAAEEEERSRITESKEAALAHQALAEAYSARLTAKVGAPAPAGITEGEKPQDDQDDPVPKA